MVMVKTGPWIRSEDIIAGTITAADLAADSVATSKIAANGVVGSSLSTTSLSQVIRQTGPGLGALCRSIGSGVYSINLTGFNARFAWALGGSSDRMAQVFTIAAAGSNARVVVRSMNDAGGGSARLVPALSDSITICWVL